MVAYAVVANSRALFVMCLYKFSFLHPLSYQIQMVYPQFYFQDNHKEMLQIFSGQASIHYIYLLS